MNAEEFRDWSGRLFVAFPGLWEWLQKSSPDPKGTQAVWRSTLEPYTQAECDCVLADWSSGRKKPFEAYEREKVHLLVRAIIGLDRDRERKRKENALPPQAYTQLPHSPYTSINMAQQMGLLLPIRRRLSSGEITECEYERLRKPILDAVV